MIIPVMAEKEMSVQQDKPAQVLNGKPNASRRVSFSRSVAEYDLSRKMAPFLDIHLLLPVFDWLEESKISFLTRFGRGNPLREDVQRK